MPPANSQSHDPQRLADLAALIRYGATAAEMCSVLGIDEQSLAGLMDELAASGGEDVPSGEAPA